MRITGKKIAIAALGASAAALLVWILSPSPFVHADGTELRRGWRGFEVRGAALMDDSTLWDAAATAPDPLGISERDVAFSAVGDTNSVRLALKTDYFIDEDGKPREAGFDFLNRVISHAERFGLLVLIDIHIPAGGGVQDYRESQAAKEFWASPALKDRFVEGWKEIASRYRNDRRILGYELMNEPAGDPDAYWELMGRTVHEIRSVDRRHLIVIHPASDWSLRKIRDRNIAYAVHLYTPLSFTHQNVPWDKRYSSMRRVIYPGVAFDKPGHITFCDRDTLAAALKKPIADSRSMKAPLILGEFGVSTAADEDSTAMWIADAIEIEREMGLAGYLYWRQVDKGKKNLSKPRNATMAVINADGSYFSPAQFFGIRPEFARENPGFDAKSFYLNYVPFSPDKPIP